jgi:hypothetical protein
MGAPAVPGPWLPLTLEDRFGVSLLSDLAGSQTTLSPLKTQGIKMMLVTFTCPAYADITMFGDVAVRLIKMMGHSGTVPSALLAADVPAALARLEVAVEAERQLPEPEESVKGDDEEPAVSLPHRALPLIELLKAAAKAECNVMWDSNQ